MTIKSEREELEKMLNGSTSSLSNNEPNKESLEGEDLQNDPLFQVDFKKIKANSKKKAKKLIKSATGLLLNDITSNPYLKQKMEMDIISLSGLLYQLEVNETMQKALMEEVQAGAASPRMFEVFSTQTKAIGEINKQLLQTLEEIKRAYRDIKIDIEGQSDLTALSTTENVGIVKDKDGGMISIGTTELIKQAKKIKILSKQDIDVEDVEEIKD